MTEQRKERLTAKVENVPCPAKPGMCPWPDLPENHMTHDHPSIAPGDIIAARGASSGIIFNTESHSTVLFSRSAAGRFRVHWLSLARWIIAEYRRRPNESNTATS